MDLLKKHFDIALESPDGISKLRTLILTLAMQGKLVKQDTKNESAKYLLEKIQIEKQKLVEKGIIRKQKDILLIKLEEIPYNIPSNWTWVRMSNVLDVRDGTHDTPKYVESGYPLITSKNLYSGKLNFDNISYISEQDHLKITERSGVDFGDILFAMIGSIGNPVIVDVRREFSIKNVALFKFYSKNGPYNRFVWFYLSLAQEIMKEKSSGAVQSFVSLNYLRNYIFPLPPLEEQKRIVTKIDELMNICDKLEEQRDKRDEKRISVHAASINRLLESTHKNEFNTSWQFISRNFESLYSVKENVTELKKAILTLAMQGKLVKQDPNDQPASELLKTIKFEKEKLINNGNLRRKIELMEIKQDAILYNLPDNWEWCRFSDIAQHNSGKTLDSGRNTGELRDYITTSNLYWGFFKLENIRKMQIREEELDKCTAKFGDLLICEGGEAGRAAVWNENYEICFQNHIHRARFYKGINPYYLYNFFRNINGTGELNNYRKGVGISSMSSKVLANIVLPLPPIAEQNRIVKRINELMIICDQLESTIDRSSKMKTVIFDAVLSKV